MIELQTRGNTLRKRIAAKEIHHRIDHVDTANLLIANLLHFGIQDAGLVLLDEQHRTRAVFCFNLGEIHAGVDAA